MFRVNLYTVFVYRNGSLVSAFRGRSWNAADALATYWRDRRYTAVIRVE